MSQASCLGDHQSGARLIAAVGGDKSLFQDAGRQLQEVKVFTVIGVFQVKYRQRAAAAAAAALYSTLPETLETKHAKEAAELQSDVRRLGRFKTVKKYSDEGRKEMTSSLYSQLPETAETQFARELTELQSEVPFFYKEKFNREKGKSSYANMKTLPEVDHAMEVNKNQSEVGYRKGKEELHHYSSAPDRPDIVNATNAAKLASFQAGQPGNTQLTSQDRSAARGRKYSNSSVSNVSSSLFVLQVKYKESFDRNLKGQKPRYNPLDCLSFKHSQAAAALASQVKYKTNQNQRPEGSADLPNLLQLEHVLHASKLQSNVEYKKKYEQTKAQHHAAEDTAEQLHHKENAVLHSQVKYRQEYERSKGRSQMEFADTQTYKVSKEAQKMQSEREYRRDFELEMKGKALVDVDQTPGYLTARHAIVPHHTCFLVCVVYFLTGAVSLQKQYRKDLEQQVKGRGLSGVGLEDTPELLRVRKANQILNQSRAAGHSAPLCLQKEYRRDLERDIVGKGMELSADVLEIQRAKRASEIQSQKKYKDEAERLKGSYSLVPETPEMERVRANQRHISSVSYMFELRGRSCTELDTPEYRRVRKSQDSVSMVAAVWLPCGS
uniref:Nebulette n=1 Tax=Stegastes partitus TaxID=144197 RepID=A0A3B5BKR9_9TELE